jgi:small conductance mechanosensitive channel
MPELAQLLHDLAGLTPERAWDWFLGKPVQIVVTVVAAVVLRWVLLRFISRTVTATLARADARRSQEPSRAGRVIAQATGAAHERHRQRTLTMGSLLRSIVTFVVALITVLTVMQIVHIPLGPLLASAGVGGVALGFGAQSLVKDFLSGIFMIFEDQYGVGDVVDVGEASGTVEAVSLRVTRLRDLNGTVWYVPNGEILRVGNMSQNWSRAVVDITVGYHEDLARVERVLREVAHDLWDDDEFRGLIIEEPEVTGVEVFGPDAVTLRVLIKTAPMEQWGVARTLRQRIKARLDHEGIEIALPQRVVWHREEPTPDAPTETTTGSSPEEEEPVTGG